MLHMGSLNYIPMEGGNQTSYKSRVILRDCPKITMKCLGWCPVVAPVAEESLFFFQEHYDVLLKS